MRHCRIFAGGPDLTVTNAKIGLESIKSKLDSVKIDNQVYCIHNASTHEIKDFESIHFLPAYDKFLVSYKDKSASLEQKFTKTAIISNGIFRPTIVVNGKAEGLWKRTVKKDHVLIETHFFN